MQHRFLVIRLSSVVANQKTLLKHIDDIDVQYENSQHVLKKLKLILFDIIFINNLIADEKLNPDTFR